MSDEAYRYLLGEAAEECLLYICFRYLEERHAWTLERFQAELQTLVADGMCGFYDREDNAVSLADLDFSDAEKLKFISFNPSEKARPRYSALLAESGCQH